ncbi:PREDICTED: probable peroxisomal acyl-coenzyme A oxidase 1 [Nicrophorus vespilloides]|uniref:Acyl-coenzyme A oxidase n=1 Tax=Nicrophorus vespilloides TaxID=110193 RepID=A0ABM1M138_NICVS|nr:PREDICTED: probable peroxisomal acyl-coenzyme A oxidase 1 [Nicrophorus vespilloides]
MNNAAPVKVNPDLLRERQKCTFNNLELTHLLDGGADKTAERREREEFFLNDPEFKSKTPVEYLSHKEKYEESVRRACLVLKKVQQLQDQGKGGIDNYRQVIGAQLGSALLQDGNPIALHYIMFIPTLMGQGTIDQQAEWIQRAWNLEIIGTYAQTELGHGTFIRGLETTATYDAKTQEFVLHSPTLTSYKWWPGGLGHSSNYAVVMAQLYTQEKCRGMHAFIVQLRDEETNMPLPGIKIGEIGCKLGMNATNNGFLGFEKVRIPRNHLLMKNSKVLEDGTYVKAPSSKLAYGTMIFVRVVIVEDAAFFLRKAVTIATRYSAVRHQCQLKAGEPETQIMDYITQQYKLFPNIATFFAYSYVAKWLWEYYNNVTGELEAGILDRLPELHAIACCLKAVASADAAAGVETCRLACGGHGYMTSSSLPTTYGLVTAMCTYEGENTVLLLQTARFLMKSCQSVMEGKSMTPTIKYLETYQTANIKPFEKNIEWIISALKKMAASKIQTTFNHMSSRAEKGMAPEDAWNETSIELVGAAESHCRVNVVEIYYNMMLQIKNTVSEELRVVLFQLVNLYAVHIALRYTGDLLRYTNTLGKDIEELQSWLEELLAAIRPNAVGIVDSFDIRDEILMSTLGSYDGNVYERLFEEASKSPLNAEPVNKSFRQYLQPLLKSNM